jgi:hypothetical protein
MNKVTDYWKDEVLAECSEGDWNAGVVAKHRAAPQPPITPSLHYSITPLFHHSTTPIPVNFGGLTVFNRGSRRVEEERQTI